MFSNIRKMIMKITHLRFFNEIYVFILACITLLGWSYSSNAGMIAISVLGIITLILTDDLKYILPNVIFFVFTFNEGFANNEFPIPIIVIGGLFIICILFFSFRRGIHFNKMKSLIGLAGLGITTLLPILWMRNVESGYEVINLLYISDLGYLLLYIIMVNGIKEKSMDMFATSMSFLAIILTFQCLKTVWESKDAYENILSMSYSLGWGICNEAGIMLCLSVPFIFYLVSIQNKMSGIIYHNVKIVIAVIGMVLTTSRGTYLFGVIEVLLLYFVLLFTARNKKHYTNFFFVFFLAILVVMVCFKSQIIKLVMDIKELVFAVQWSGNGREVLWRQAFDIWNQKPLYRLLGPGITCVLNEQMSTGGWQLVPVVFHSTLFETMATGGMIGIAFLMIHLYQKYFHLYRSNKTMFITLGVGLLVVDIYGLIDNTFHMYYYMLPYVSFMATLDVDMGQERLEIDFTLGK